LTESDLFTISDDLPDATVRAGRR